MRIEEIVSTSFRLKRATKENWVVINPILGNGEPGFEIDTGSLKIGNGINNWIELSYANNEQLQKAISDIALGLDNKVDKDGNKVLSDNNYTDEDKIKVGTALQPNDVDQAYSSTSTKPLSGAAVDEALTNFLPAIPDTPEAKFLNGNKEWVEVITAEEKSKIATALQPVNGELIKVVSDIEYVTNVDIYRIGDKHYIKNVRAPTIGESLTNLTLLPTSGAASFSYSFTGTDGINYANFDGHMVSGGYLSAYVESAPLDLFNVIKQAYEAEGYTVNDIVMVSIDDPYNALVTTSFGQIATKEYVDQATSVPDSSGNGGSGIPSYAYDEDIGGQEITNQELIDFLWANLQQPCISYSNYYITRGCPNLLLNLGDTTEPVFGTPSGSLRFEYGYGDHIWHCTVS